MVVLKEEDYWEQSFSLCTGVSDKSAVYCVFLPVSLSFSFLLLSGAANQFEKKYNILDFVFLFTPFCLWGFVSDSGMGARKDGVLWFMLSSFTYFLTRKH
jgi:hypothetical protein